MENTSRLNQDQEETDFCFRCEVVKEFKIVDVDGTNLVEAMICPECKAGTPALN